VEICDNYRGPVLSYLRQHGYAGADAEDLTQEFFARLIEQRWDTRADPTRGRFRSFLLTALHRFLANEQAGRHAEKRGGALRQIDLEDVSLEAPAEQSPECVFNRAWVLALMGHAATRLEQEARAAGREALYQRLADYLVESPDSADYAHIADSLGIKPNTVAMHVHRLRRRLRELMREELLQTVSDADGLDAELNALRDIINSGHLR
jgi:RNA polymerase sigma-70 factor (ECF subfamily)